MRITGLPFLRPPAGGTQPVQHQFLPGDFKSRIQLLHLLLQRRQRLAAPEHILHPAAAGALQVEMGGEVAVKPVGLVFQGKAADLPLLLEAVEVAVNGGQPDLRILPPHQLIEHFRAGMFPRLGQALQDQLFLNGVALLHSGSPLIIVVRP